MAFKKILCPVDFSPGALTALETAVRLAGEHDSELTIVHVWNIPAIAMAEFAYPGDLVQLIRDDAQRGLDQALADARGNGAKRVTGKLLTGVPWGAIVDELADPTYDLVVLGTHGRTGVRRFLMGSVAEQVIRHAPCSVLVQPAATEQPGPYRHVLCPVDFSDSARGAMYLAGELARGSKAGVFLLHAIELPLTWSFEIPTVQIERELDKQATALLETWEADLKQRADISVTRRAQVGSASIAILDALDADPTLDLVVMGSHGRTGVKRAFLGSVAETVARHARCPVLVTRSRA